MSYMDYCKKEIPVIGEYDVVVVGGGTAGAVAAISSGMEKLKTLVIEQFGSLGGAQTNAMVTPIMHSCKKGNPSCSSISDQIYERMSSRGSTAVQEDNDNGWFDPTMLKIVLEEMVLESGCEILYYTTLVDIAKQDKRIEKLIIHNKNGLSAVTAKRFIDCTGDADVAYLAGVPLQSGNKDGLNQSVSLRFEMANVDVSKFGDFLTAGEQKRTLKYPTLHTAFGFGAKNFDKLVREKHEEGMLTDQDLSHLQMFSVPGRPGCINFNCPELGKQVNVLDAAFMSQKQIEGKKAILRIAGFMKKCVPGFENAYITEIAPMLGIRESRRIEAEYRLSKEDIFNYRKFEDGIATSNYPLDIHGATKEEKVKAYITIERDQAYWEIPYRSLIPKSMDNLLVAGRCAGFDFHAQSAARVQHTCRAMGEAAGIAARISIEQDVTFKEVEGRQVKEVMLLRQTKF